MMFAPFVELKMIRILVGFVVLFGLVVIAFLLIATRIEQNTFNKFSKTKATYIEAMFTNLRIIPD